MSNQHMFTRLKADKLCIWNHFCAIYAILIALQGIVLRMETAFCGIFLIIDKPCIQLIKNFLSKPKDLENKFCSARFKFLQNLTHSPKVIISRAIQLGGYSVFLYFVKKCLILTSLLDLILFSTGTTISSNFFH